MLQTSQYFFALLSTTCFAAATLVFTEYSHRVNAIWMNCVKAGVALIACCITIQLFYQWHPISSISLGFFIFSGFFALNLGDILLLKAFQRIGPGRTLVLFGFHPLTLGIASYFIFNQKISTDKLYAIIFLVACLVTFSYEKFKQDGHWEIKGFLLAFAAVSMDAVGLIATRLGFDNSPLVLPLEGHFYRCLGASLGFILIQIFFPFGLITHFKKLSINSKTIVIIGSFIGTFLSLWASFIALQYGNIATLTAITITGPFLATLFECIYYKKRPTRYLVLAFSFFIIGFVILIR